MGRLLRGLVAMVVLGAGAAVAAPCNDAHLATPQYGVSVAPPPAGGHWVSRAEREWVPGHWTIKYTHHHRGERVFIPGHYQTVARQVFIGGPAYGTTVVPPPPARWS